MLKESLAPAQTHTKLSTHLFCYWVAQALGKEKMGEKTYVSPQMITYISIELYKLPSPSLNILDT